MMYIMKYAGKEYYLDRHGDFLTITKGRYERISDIPDMVREWADYKLTKRNIREGKEQAVTFNFELSE